MSEQKSKPESKTLATNRKALHDYFIVEKFEAGIELLGAEVKSIRAGHVSLNEAFARIDKNQVFLYGMHVQPYSHSSAAEHDPIRTKRLLLHREEIQRLLGKTAEKGHTLIPLRLYINHGKIKVEIALGRGKQDADKRDTLRKKTADKEVARALASRRR